VLRFLFVSTVGILLVSWSAASDLALFSAARNGTVLDVSTALDNGADVNAVDRDGFSPLLLAVHFNTAHVVEALLDAGADAEYVNPSTGMGAFAYVWRNPESAHVHAVLNSRGLVATVRMPGDLTTEPQSSGGAAGTPSSEPPTSTPEFGSALLSRPSASAPQSTVSAQRAIVDAPFRVSEVRSGWTRAPNVLGGTALVVPEVRFMLLNDQNVDIARLSIQAEFFIRRESGVLERFGSDTTYVVGSSDLPLRPGVQEEVRVKSGVGYVDNGAPVVRNIKRGSPPPTLVEMYFRTDRDWIRFLSFDIDRSYRP
jgi:hypothetical protein